MVESKIVQEVLEDLAKNTQKNYMTTLRQFKTFVNSKEGLRKEISIDSLITEAKSDITKTQERMDLFYKWLRGEEVEGYKPRDEKRKPMRESSANQRVYGYLRGFFVNIDVAFEKKWKRKIPKVTRTKQAIKKDEVYTFYDVDEETRTIQFNRDRMQQFLSNLKLRDQATTLALLSSSQDSGDLFKLNIGDVKNQSNKRIYWTGTRQKTTVLFKTFISKEATRFIWKYINQERQGADDSKPLFVYTRGGQPKRMTATNLASIYRDAARRMGIKWENGEQNPLRPKRLRHLFRTACDTAGIPELYTNAYMGHRNHMGQSYSELSRAKLELEYLRVEPFLTVYGEVEESLEVKQDVRKLEKIIVKLNRDVEEQKRTIESLSKVMEGKVEEITRKLWQKWLTELKQEELFAIKAEQEKREPKEQ